MIEWHNEKRKIKELVPYVSNPRQITEKQAEDLKKSLDKFGLAASLVINTDNTIIGGHQRKKIMETLMQMPPDYEIDVRVPERKLSIDEVRELNVRLNKNVAEWDFDILANNFELEDLIDWGFEKDEFNIDDDFYTGKVEPVCYEPTANMPEINELYDNVKAEELIAEIKKSDYLSESEREFLILAAYRHVVFNFSKIADYYANSEKHVQGLMERSALVIIDYDKAIANGFVEFLSGVRKQYAEEYE